MANLHFLVGVGVLFIVTLVLLGLAQEGYEDDDGFKPGRPPDGRDQQKQTVTSAIDRKRDPSPRPGSGK